MAKIEIVESLFEELEKQFKKEASLVFDLMDSVAENPKKWKPLGTVGGILIKELRYKGFSIYFILDGHKIKFLDEQELKELLILFVRMSDKKHQQQTINEIKHILRTIGPVGFE